MSSLCNVMLVDDDDIFVYLTKKTIDKTELINLMNVVNNGFDAINFFKENAGNPEALPEIILLDLSMPVMDGWQFLEEYTLLAPQLNKKIVIYIITSSISPDDIEKARRIAAVSDYMIKPVTKEKLTHIVKSLYV